MIEGWMRTGEAAHKMGISRSAVNRLIARGTLRARFAGGMSWIHIDELRRLAADPMFRARSRAMDDRALNALLGQEVFDYES